MRRSSSVIPKEGCAYLEEVEVWVPGDQRYRNPHKRILRDREDMAHSRNVEHAVQSHLRSQYRAKRLPRRRAGSVLGIYTNFYPQARADRADKLAQGGPITAGEKPERGPGGPERPGATGRAQDHVPDLPQVYHPSFEGRQ
jgi:hypothetical protein